MEQGLEIFLLGGLTLKKAGRLLPSLPTRKAEALLIYLATNGKAYPREQLAELLWQRDSHTQARRNLTYDLYRLRQLFGSYIIATRQTVAFNQQATYWLDVAELEEQVSGIARSHFWFDKANGSSSNQVDINRLNQTETSLLSEAEALKLADTLVLYRGDFLAGFHLVDAPDFEDWVTTTRERLHRLVIEGMHHLINYYVHQTNYRFGIEWARRLLTLDGFDETGHKQLIHLLALNNQRGLALSQYESYCCLVQDEFGVEPSAHIQALYDQIQNDNLTPLEYSPTPVTFPETPFQAPPPPPYFVGRDQEVANLQRYLTQQPGPRIHALVGMGGVGKTTLAAYLAHQLRETFPDGVLWANAALSTPMDILVTWAKAYHHDFSNLADVHSRAAAVRNLLADKQILLVVDNVVGSKDVQALLPNGKQCAVLLTTRDLDVAHALKATPLLLGELSPENARQLLIQILGEARVIDETDAAREICTLLHHLPLAVEIAAQRLKSRRRLKLTHLATRLQEMKHRLGLKISDEAVRASFEVSWEALDETLSQLFPLLAVFEGRPFATEAIAYVANDDLFEIEDQLYALVALSLLTEDGDRHFRQHPLLADFAREKLIDNQTIYRRLSDYYLTFAQTNHKNHEALQPEWENILAAIFIAYQQQRWLIVVDYTNALADIWFTRGRHSDARQAYQWANEAGQQLNNLSILASNLLQWGEACLEQNDYDEAEQHFNECFTYYQEADNQAGIATVYCRLARIYLERDYYDKARDALTTSLTLRTQLGDIEGIAEVLFQQTFLYYTLDQFEEAQHVAEQALALQEQATDHNPMIPTLRLLAHTLSRLKLHELAQSYGKRAKALSEALHNQDELSAALYCLVCVSMNQGAFELAKRYSHDCLELLRRMGLRDTEGQLLLQLSKIHIGLNDYQAALESALKSLEIHRELQNKLNCAQTLKTLGDLYQHLGQLENGKLTWQEALTISEAINHTSMITLLQKRLKTI